MKKIVLTAYDQDGNIKEFQYDFRYERFIEPNKNTPKQLSLKKITNDLIKKIKEKLNNFLEKHNLNIIDCEIITQSFTRFNCIESHLFYKIS
jgi:hypothetical protein